MQDFEVDSPTGEVGLLRTFSSNPNNFDHRNGDELRNVPKPFGSRGGSTSLTQWWHSLFSYVLPQYHSGAQGWDVRDVNGSWRDFGARDGNVLAVGWDVRADAGTTKLGEHGHTDRLFRTDAGTFVYFVEGGPRYYYESKFVQDSQEQLAADKVRLFLTRSETNEGAERYRLTYAVPTFGQGDPCPQGLDGGEPGVPYIDEVQIGIPAGTSGQPASRLKFGYRQLVNSDGGTECVVSQVSAIDSNDGGTTVLATYGYDYPDGGIALGRLTSVSYPNATLDGGTRIAEYQYDPTYVRELEDGVLKNEFNLSGSRVSSFKNGPNGYTIGALESLGGTPKTFRETFSESGLPRGDGSGLVDVTYLEAPVTQVESSAFGGPRLHSEDAGCSIANACGAGTTSFGLELATAAPFYAQENFVKSARGEYYTLQLHQAATDSNAPSGLRELIKVTRGATSPTGTGLDTNYTYGYAGAQAAFQQHLKTESKASVLSVGNSAVTTRRFDSTNNKLLAEIRKGWTKNLSGVVEGPRHRGTFYFYATSTQDPHQRLREVHGPCELVDPVDVETVSDCPGSSYPRTVYEYWPESETTNRRLRLKSVKRYVDSTETTALVTTYDAYDARGQPTSVTDENGALTAYEYRDGRVARRTVAGAATSYHYEGGRLVRVDFPEGNSEVYCYRTGATTAACADGTPSLLLQWKAKADLTGTPTWSEKIEYSYFPNKDILKEERYLDGASGALRRIRRFEPDANRRPTWEAWGASGSGQYFAARRFDAADNLIAVGLPFNAPEGWCLAGSNTSTKCTALQYDALDRISRVDQYPNANGTGASTFFSYLDAQGSLSPNLTSVRTGCSTSDSSECATMPATTYEYNDFGEIVASSVPDQATIRYTYNALGNVIGTQKSTSTSWLEYIQDRLGRVTAAVEHRPAPYGDQTLYTMTYGDKSVLSTDEQTACSLPSNAFTSGRLLKVEDSSGKTYFQYDAHGRVLNERRRPPNTTFCGTRGTGYSYSLNGNLTSIIYPYGRTVSYVYGTGARRDRIAAIDVKLRGASDWNTSPTRLIETVSWEPYGGLRGYQLNHITTATSSGLEYALGGRPEDTSADPSSCAALSFPSTPSESSGGGDATGRVRGTWLTAGAFTPGSPGATPLLRQLYGWSADQLRRQDTCALAGTTPITETFRYDQLLRLTEATRPSGNLVRTHGGAYQNRWYRKLSGGSELVSYDGRGNRRHQAEDCSEWTLTQDASGAAVDRLRSRSLGRISYSYTAGDNGVSGVSWQKDSSNGPARRLGLLQAMNSTNGGDNTVYVQVNLYTGTGSSAGTYQYFYDARMRRLKKIYPTTVEDHFYYAHGANQLLVDRGNDSTAFAPLTPKPVDSYIWLDDRPVAVIRSSITEYNDNAPQVNQDGVGSCSRYGDNALCGVYHLVTDRLGKPIASLDSSRRISGLFDYEPFGRLNFVAYPAETPLDGSYTGDPPLRPYPTSAQRVLAYIQRPVESGLSTAVRARFHLVDTDGCGATPADYVYFTDISGAGTELASRVGGARKGPIASEWFELPTTSENPARRVAHVRFRSDSALTCPDSGGCALSSCAQGAFQYQGAVMEGYEYRRHESTASPLATPLRFPGHYYDAETGWHENWHRTYDPASGRYLQPEPLLQAPRLLALKAQHEAQILPAYAYALNNPNSFVDQNGLSPNPCTPVDSTYSCCLKKHPNNPQRCGASEDDDLPKKIQDCYRKALAAFEKATSEGKSVSAAEAVMDAVYRECLKKLGPLSCQQTNPGPDKPPRLGAAGGG